MKPTDTPNLFLHDNGFYYVRRMIHGRAEKKSTRKRDLKSATRRYMEIMKAWNDGASGWETPETSPTFARYWLDSYRAEHTVKKTPLKPDVYNDDYLIQAPLKFFGPHKLHTITNTMCQRFANQRRAFISERRDRAGKVYHRAPLAEGTITRQLTFVQAVFEQAKRDGYLTKNPMSFVPREPYASRPRVLTPEEQVRLMAALSPKYQRWVLFMIGTGLRIAEAVGIDPSTDIDLDARTVTVTRKTRGLKKKLQTLPLFDDDVVAVLREQLTSGDPWASKQPYYRDLLAAASAKAGIEHLSPHALRHTFATRYLQAGGDIYKLSLLLGHASVVVTEKVYAHLLTTDLAEASKHIKLGLLATAAPAS